MFFFLRPRFRDILRIELEALFPPLVIVLSADISALQFGFVTLTLMVVGAIILVVSDLLYPGWLRIQMYAEQKPLEFINTFTRFPYIVFSSLTALIILIIFGIFALNPPVINFLDIAFRFQLIGQTAHHTIVQTGLVMMFWIVYVYLGLYLGLRFSMLRFHYITARAYVLLSSTCAVPRVGKSMERLMQLGYVIRGLKSYNRFLQTNLNLQIKDIEKLYSTITLGTPENQGLLIERIRGAFSRDDSLKILKEVGSIIGTEPAEVLSKSEKIFLSKPDWVAIVAAIIPLVIAVLTTFHILKGP